MLNREFESNINKLKFSKNLTIVIRAAMEKPQGISDKEHEAIMYFLALLDEDIIGVIEERNDALYSSKTVEQYENSSKIFK